ncbi:septal ring lytic transglycosylase RlpA family protein [Marinagarivorans algicola]|uniref:septal ring lytic transglycosylase RlpA family protein n=1 Tax=Marinagarivorans algicola TaxID=1513270 RepID=UPI000AD7FDF8|nr:septal ring lytic transglycosylase RlpA family protein [Marinagarivorans algicola]
MFFFTVIFFTLMTGCQSHRIRYEIPVDIDVKDSGPAAPLDVEHIPDADPVKEPRTKAGNKSPYTVLGKTYHLMNDSTGFTQKGYASWYGKKFHGKKTSNGEIYNMYGMTAAHKTLPIPTFVRVTNIANGKNVIVRVNDRGPFHGDRIIDLTYTAARKLGFAGQGTARVMLEVVEAQDQSHFKGFDDSALKPHTASTRVAPKPRNSGGYEVPEGTYLQMGAFGQPAGASAFAQKVKALTTYPVIIETVAERNIQRVLLGPLKDNWDLVNLQQFFKQEGYQEPKVVYKTFNLN